jgi:hypothetical protein
MKLRSYERLMIEMFVAWAPYGGPPEDEVWIEFGMSRARMADKVAELVDKCFRDFVPPEDRLLLLTARRELHPSPLVSGVPTDLRK